MVNHENAISQYFAKKADEGRYVVFIINCVSVNGRF